MRALVDVGDSFVLLARQRVRADPERFERTLIQPLSRLLERGQAAGDIRDDISGARLTESLIGSIIGMLVSTRPLGRMVEGVRRPVGFDHAGQWRNGVLSDD